MNADRMLSLMLPAVFLVGFTASAGFAASAPRDSLPIKIVISAGQAEAAVAILLKHEANARITERDWTRLFATEGYRRLKEREASMGRAFDDAGMRAFLLSDSMKARATDLGRALAQWNGVQALAAARRAFVYLPPGTPIEATAYLVIKPRPNSFVFDLRGDPAIFLFVDPEVPPARLANTIAHELHHIGLSRVCRDGADSSATPAQRAVRRWTGAFGEGVAVLAASGGPLVHPDLTWSKSDQVEWKRDMRDAPYAMTRLERFFVAIADGSLSDPDSVRTRVMPFYGNRGAWYTVGYQMANAVERAFGRERLIGMLCDMRQLVIAYQAAVPIIAAQYGAELPKWSEPMMALMDEAPAPADD